MSAAVKLLVKGSSVTSLTDKVVDETDVKRMGYLRKLKTMKKKFFVLHLETESGPSRLEYFDTEKKWRAGTVPKRSINLKTCFNINRKLDTKHKCVIALYTKDDCFAVSLDNETELDQWLTALLELQHGEEYLDTDEKPKPNFEHVWQVTVKSKGLGSSKNILGPHRLCLTERTLSLVKMSTDCPIVQEFPLMSIRRCGHSDCFFFMEVGRSAMTGAGELWMLTEDTLIAQNMHEAILNAMKSTRKDDVAPRPRTRSSSANEASKPISVHTRRQTTASAVAAAIDAANANSRERSDSMPTRPRTVSDGQKPDITSRMYSRTVSCSPPQNAISPVSVMYDSTGSSISIDDCDSSQPEMLLCSSKYGHLTDDMPSEPPIEEEVLTGSDSYISMAPGEVSSKREADDQDGYMEMNPSAGLDATSRGLLSIVTQSKAQQMLISTPLSLNLLPTSGPKSFMPPQTSATTENYMEMSPVSNPSAGTPDGYMPMSPVGSSYLLGTDKPRSSIKNGYTPNGQSGMMYMLAVDRAKEVVSSGSHSANGQVHPPPPPEGSGSYVAMAPIKDSLSPPQEDEGYIDMTPMGHSLPRSTSSGIVELKAEAFSSRRSSGTSGTPSTDMCFAEYQLDKVRAYFTPSEDDDEEPMVRACSIGSRSDCNRKRDQLEIATDSARTRAFSMGSRVGVKFGSKMAPAVVNPSASAALTEQTAEEKNKKSSSAPILGTSPLGSSWSGTSYLQKIYGGNRSSTTNEDLMEMDFPDSKNCSSGSLAESGSRKSAASSTDSLRRAPSASSTGSRPRTNSRSSHSRPTKLETLQSIGESSSPSSTLITKVHHEYAEMNASSASQAPQLNQDGAAGGPTTRTTTTTGHASKLTSKLSTQLSLDYLDVNPANRSDFAEILGGGHRLMDNRKRSLPEQILIRGHPNNGRISPSGEYVNIDPNRVVNSPRISSITENSSPSSASVSLESSRRKHLDYVNLQYGSLEGSSAALSKPIPVGSSSVRIRNNLDTIVDQKLALAVDNVQCGHQKKLEQTSSIKRTDFSGLPPPASATGSGSHSDYAVMEPLGLSLKSKSSLEQDSLSSPSSTVSSLSDDASNSARLTGTSSSSTTMTTRRSSSKDLFVVAPAAIVAVAVVSTPSPNSSSSTSSNSQSNLLLLRPSSVTVDDDSRPYENMSFAKPDSRPSSVSSVRELNYASLDLAPSTSAQEDGQDLQPAAAPPPPPPPTSSSTVTTTNVEPTQLTSTSDGRPLSYAKIDFAKSEGLRYTSSSSSSSSPAPS